MNSTTPDQAIVLLKPFLSADERPQGTLSYEELMGFLFVLVCTPERIPTEEWLPFIFGEDDPNYRDEQERSQVIDALLALHGEWRSQVKDDDLGLPADCSPTANACDNFGPEAAFGRWAHGFLMGFHWLAETWDEALPNDWLDEFDMVTMLLTFFASREVAEEYRKDFENPEESLDVLAAHLLDAIPEAIQVFADMGRNLYHLQKKAARPSSATKKGPGRSPQRGKGRNNH